MSISTQTTRINPEQLNQETTQQAVLDALLNIGQATENGWHESAQTIASTGNDITVFTSTSVPVGESRWVNKVDITCNRAGKFTILVGASIIGSGRTSPSERNVPFLWMPGYKLISAEVLTVKFEQFSGTDANIEVYTHGIEK